VVAEAINNSKELNGDIARQRPSAPALEAAAGRGGCLSRVVAEVGM
jgi:hypothetical protein